MVRYIYDSKTEDFLNDMLTLLVFAVLLVEQLDIGIFTITMIFIVTIIIIMEQKFSISPIFRAKIFLME